MIGYLFAAELGLLAVWASVACLLDAYGRRTLSDEPADVIIVPGCAVTSDGTPSAALARRVRLAVRLANQGRAPLIVFTGGLGRYPPTESEAARALCVQLGVPADQVRVETRSTNTAQNARYAAELFDNAADLCVVIATDGYHCFRCKRLFSRFFRSVRCAGATPPARSRVRGAMREVVSLAKMVVLALTRR